MKKFLIYFVYFLLFAIATVLFIIAYPTYKKNKKAEADSVEMRKKSEQIQQKCGELNVEVNGLKSDKKAIERVAREKFKLAEQGEIIYRYDDRPNDTKKSPSNKK